MIRPLGLHYPATRLHRRWTPPLGLVRFAQGFGLAVMIWALGLTVLVVTGPDRGVAAHQRDVREAGR